MSQPIFNNVQKSDRQIDNLEGGRGGHEIDVTKRDDLEDKENTDGHRNNNDQLSPNGIHVSNVMMEVEQEYGKSTLNVINEALAAKQLDLKCVKIKKEEQTSREFLDHTRFGQKKYGTNRIGFKTNNIERFEYQPTNSGGGRYADYAKVSGKKSSQHCQINKSLGSCKYIFAKLKIPFTVK